ncbi:MAG: hypothetical protein J2P18_20330 [Nocardia sp.]|nr:hypothetical protein [Nocardia sp.]
MVLAVTLSALAVGCGEGPEATSDAEVEPSGLGKEITMPIAAASARLVSPGSQPRAPLRPAVAPGTSQQVTLRTDHHVEQQINSQAAGNFSAPTVTIPLTASLDHEGIALALGTATSTDPDLAQQLLTADGSHAGFELGDNGAITRFRLATAPDSSESARAALERAFNQAVYNSLVFPNEPVGTGAVWTVRQQISDDLEPNGAEQVTTARLTGRTGNLLTIALDVTQTPKSRAWKLPGNGGSLDIVGYAMHGTGTVTVDLGLPLPVSGSVTVLGNQSYRDPRASVLLRQDVRTQVRWGR